MDKQLFSTTADRTHPERAGVCIIACFQGPRGALHERCPGTRGWRSINSERLAGRQDLLRTRQEISKTEISILELRNRYVNEVTATLRQTKAELDALGRRAETAIELLHESEISAPRLLARQAWGR